MIPASSLWSTAATADPSVCPYLGLADDPRTHFAFATTAHRCHSPSGPGRIEVSHQAALCLGANYPACRRYAAPIAAAGPASGPAIVVAEATPPIAHVSGRVRWRGSEGRHGLLIRAAAVLGAAVILVAVLLAVARFLPAGGPPGVAGSGSPASLLGPSASLASPVGSLAPTPTASVAPTSEPTPSPSPSGSVCSLPTTHVVARGETLTSIARRYGVTLAALEKANGIKNPSLIVVGQRLIIPAH